MSNTDAADDRLLAIGDIHGCLAALDRLVEELNPQPQDLLVFLGDFVDRGPDSRGVINRMIELGRNTRVVGILGNHEQMMLDVLRNGSPHHAWLRYGGVETLDSYGFTGDVNILPPEHNQFFDSLLPFFEHEDFIFTHAALDPVLPLDQQPDEMLRWYSIEQGVPGPHISGKTTVVGHTANREGQVVDVGHLICLDTYCYGGGWLTAMDLRTRQVWQASQEGNLRQEGEAEVPQERKKLGWLQSYLNP